MIETPTTYELAVTTDRPAERIARRHGFKNVADLATSLPEGAQVIDVGAGASPFGKEVAEQRPDITWINFDYSYSDERILTEVSEGAPDNIKFIAGDATQLEQLYGKDSFDAVFSYWLLPHLSLDEPTPAISAARGMYAIAKPDAYLSVGPKTSKSKVPSLRAKDAYHTHKQEAVTADGFAETVYEKTRLTGTSRRIQRFANKVATPFFGTSRYAKRPRGIKTPRIYDPYKGEHISFFNPRGAIVLGGLAVASAKYVAKERKSAKESRA